MSGGFIPAPINAPAAEQPAPAPLLTLTPRQATRLTAYLDDGLSSLERDARKLTLGPLDALLPRLRTLLAVTLQIPPAEPWGQTRIAYLLALTGPLASYLTAAPLRLPGTRERAVSVVSDASDASVSSVSAVSAGLAGSQRAAGPAPESQRAAESAILDLLAQVERGWLAVLSGDACVFPASPARHPQPAMPLRVPVAFGAQVGATERVRLRSIALATRASVIDWARRGRAGGADGAAPGDEAEVVTVWTGLLEALTDD